MNPEQWREEVVESLNRILNGDCNPEADERTIREWRAAILEAHGASALVLWKLDHYLIGKSAEKLGGFCE